MAVESVRTGYILARDSKQYRAWRRKTKKPDEPVGLTGRALERAIMGYATTAPEYIAFGGPA